MGRKRKRKGLKKSNKGGNLQKRATKQWACSGCSKMFASEEGRDMHVEATGHVVKWSCDECGKEVQSKNAHDQHQQSTGHDVLSCNECSAEFGSLVSLAQHLDATKHCFWMFWKCPVCGDSWNRLKELADHLRLDH